MTVPATAQSKSQLAYTWLRAGIDEGRFGPGYRLVLGQIAKELGTSVVPVREAIRLLEAEGAVTYETNVGAQVALVHESEYLFTMQTLALVEGSATALSAPSLTPERINAARAINQRMIECLDHFDPRVFTELNLEFHSILFGDCPNPHILDLVHKGWKRLAMLRDSVFSFVPGRAQQSVREHERILELIEVGAGSLQIELAARDHRTATLDAVLAYQSEHPPAPRHTSLTFTKDTP